MRREDVDLGNIALEVVGDLSAQAEKKRIRTELERDAACIVQGDPDRLRQALDNPPPVLRCANAGPEHIARMTWFITDKRAYLAALAEIGQIWREKMGRHYPAMAVVEVKALIEDAALIEIETTAVVPR